MMNFPSIDQVSLISKIQPSNQIMMENQAYLMQMMFKASGIGNFNPLDMIQKNQTNNIVGTQNNKSDLQQISCNTSSNNLSQFNIVFYEASGKEIPIQLSPSCTVKDCIKKYLELVGRKKKEEEEQKDKDMVSLFIFNGKKIDINEEKNISSFGLVNDSKITVIYLDVLGATENKKISNFF